MFKILGAAAFLAAVMLGNGSAKAEETAAVSNVCQAYTACWWGGTIACETYGDACTWWVNPGVDVRCTGLNAAGYWVDLYFHC